MMTTTTFWFTRNQANWKIDNDRNNNKNNKTSYVQGASRQAGTQGAASKQAEEEEGHARARRDP